MPYGNAPEAASPAGLHKLRPGAEDEFLTAFGEFQDTLKEYDRKLAMVKSSGNVELSKG
jgi:hypothetical protein